MFVVAHNGARIWGGAERATALLLAGLQARGHRVLLLCNAELVATRAEEMGVPTRIVRLGGDAAVPHALRLDAVLRELRPDAFIIGTFRKLLLAGLGAELARVPRVVVRVGLETDTPRSSKYRFALPRWVHAVVVNATRMRAAFDALSGFAPGRVSVIHNGVEAPPRVREPGTVRAELGIAADALVIGTVARLAPQKRLDRLLRVAALLGPDVHCVVAGDGPERRALHALAAELGLGGRVHFLGHRDDTGDVLGALDLFVVCSAREGLSNAMLEALASGVPVVSTPVSGADDALDPLADGTAPGLIVAGFEEDEIAAAVRGLLGDPGLRARMADAARRRAAERFSVDGMLDRWEAVLWPWKVVIQNDSRVWGGNEKWLATLAAGLVARGHHVVVSCRADSPVQHELERRGVPTTPICPGGYADVVRGLRFRRWLRWEGPDVLLLTSWRTTPWGAWAARRAGVARTVVRLGIVRTLRPGPRDAWPFRGRVDALIVNSPAIRETWLRTAPWFPADEVHLVLNGVPAVPPLSPADRAAMRADLGLSADAAVVVGAGRLSKRKGFDFLIDAFWQADVAGSELLLVGTGEEEAALRAQAEALGIHGRVRFAGERGDVPRVLGACDLFVLSSHNEGMANVMLEAMAAGIPVAAFDVSGVRDAIGPRDGRPAAGWVAPPADYEALAAAIREALDDADEAAARVAEASWRVREWFSVERMVGEAEAALRGGS